MKINPLEIKIKIKLGKINLSCEENREKIRQDKTIEIVGLIKILLIQSGKQVTLNNLNEYNIKERKLTINIEIKNAFIPPLGTKIKIKTILKNPSKMLYFKDEICSPIEFKIPMQISWT